MNIGNLSNLSDGFRFVGARLLTRARRSISIYAFKVSKSVQKPVRMRDHVLCQVFFLTGFDGSLPHNACRPENPARNLAKTARNPSGSLENPDKFPNFELLRVC